VPLVLLIKLLVLIDNYGFRSPGVRGPGRDHLDLAGQLPQGGTNDAQDERDQDGDEYKPD
jgi:hypothetical protein